MRAWPLPAEVLSWLTALSQALHRRHAWRLLPLVVGLLFAHGRRTVTRWLRAVGIGKGFQRYYYFLGSLGRKAEFVAALLLRRTVTVVPPGERLLLGLDDPPTKRYGPQVEGAGIHHNPTPGPAEQKFLYGHIWVTLAWVVRHPLGGASACRCAPCSMSARRISASWCPGIAWTSRPSCRRPRPWWLGPPTG
jgi:hypothetical protein